MIAAFLTRYAKTIIIILAAVVVLVTLVFSSLNPWNPLNYLGRPDITVNTSRDTVIKEVRSLQKLETASFVLEKIIEAGNDGNALQDLLYGDRILLIAHGTVVAGVDLSQMDESKISVRGQDLHIELPASQILGQSLDEDKTTVYDRRLGFLSKGDKDMETRARQSALGALTQAACQGNILQIAADNAKQQVAQMYGIAGFAKVEVVAPVGDCS